MRLLLTPGKFQCFSLELVLRELVMVLLDGSTGLRRGKMIVLRWRVIDFERMQANMLHSVWRNVEEDTNAEASPLPVPLHFIVAELLRKWKLATMYNSDDDFLFPSIARNGSQPFSPDTIPKRPIQPSMKRIGGTKRIGCHSFRNGLATMLR
jgi:integrase